MAPYALWKATDRSITRVVLYAPTVWSQITFHWREPWVKRYRRHPDHHRYNILSLVLLRRLRDGASMAGLTEQWDQLDKQWECSECIVHRGSRCVSPYEITSIIWMVKQQSASYRQSHRTATHTFMQMNYRRIVPIVCRMAAYKLWPNNCDSFIHCAPRNVSYTWTAAYNPVRSRRVNCAVRRVSLWWLSLWWCIRAGVEYQRWFVYI